MVSVSEKEYLVSDWFNGAQLIVANNLNHAVAKYLSIEKIQRAREKNDVAAFGCESSDSVKKQVLSMNEGAEQAEALADWPDVVC